MVTKQFRLNMAVGVVANVARLRSHMVHVLKASYRHKPRRARMHDMKRLTRLLNRGARP